MPRSTYVYSAIDKDGNLLCTCTVKYEFRIWLVNQDPDVLEHITIWRSADSLRGVQGYSGNLLTRLYLADFDLTS